MEVAGYVLSNKFITFLSLNILRVKVIIWHTLRQAKLNSLRALILSGAYTEFQDI